VQPEIDPADCLMRPPLPTCPHCGALARPNVLMFNDGRWVDGRTEAQYGRFEAWLRQARRLVVIEAGAGTDVPSVRRMCESRGAPLIRINPREPEVPKAHDVGIAAGALHSLQGLREALQQ
jgi:NAD-dependent SIR2 family protein deacetylase